MNDITPKEANEILSHYTELGYGIVIEGDDTSKIKQALSLARKMLTHGTPYNPKGDLISRSDLKTQLEVYRHTRNYKSDEDEAQNDLLDNILEDIDNAPTVEAFAKEDMAGAYNEGYACGSRENTRPNEQIAWEQGYEAGLAQGKAETRPQGEYTRVDTLWAKCSICGNLTRVIKKYNMPNFCPACGADMRKGGEEK